MTEWNIQSRGHACSACGKSFTDKETYHTLLFDERSGFLRLDVCENCWQKQYNEGARDRKGFISYWHGVYEAPPPPTEPIQKENAESLLRKIIERNDARFAAAAFILAVMLERKRLLKVKEQVHRDDGRLFIYEQPGTGDIFTIRDPDLQLNQLEQVQHDVATLLEHGLPPEPSSPDQVKPEQIAAQPTDGAPAEARDANVPSESPVTVVSSSSEAEAPA